MFVSKSKLWGLLGNDALTFASFLNSTDPDAANINTMLQNTEGVTIDGDVVQNQIIPLLEAKGIISVETVNLFKSFVNPEVTYFIPFSDSTEKQSILDGMATECQGTYTYEELPEGFRIKIRGTYTRAGAEII